MEHDEMDVSRWVDDRLSALDPPDNWRPDSYAALARLRRRDSPRRWWWVWAAVSATAAAACAVLLLVSVSIRPACANPLGCSQPALARSAPLPTAPVRPFTQDRQTAFKESGSPHAPVTCELFSDYECPHCAAFALETEPLLVARYVETGKVRLIHRDFPLDRHRYARLAARYANAAGEAGYYQAAANRLFRTQAVWSTDGDIAGQIARAMPPAAMEKVRAIVQKEAAGDNSVAADEVRARENHVDRTPTLLCNRQSIPTNVPLSELQASLDQILVQR